jgi:hypothetical protein
MAMKFVREMSACKIRKQPVCHGWWRSRLWERQQLLRHNIWSLSAILLLSVPLLSYLRQLRDNLDIMQQYYDFYNCTGKLCCTATNETRTNIKWSRVSSVNIVTRLRAGRSVFDSRRCRDVSSSPLRPHRLWVPLNLLPNREVPGNLFPEKRPGREARYSHP